MTDGERLKEQIRGSGSFTIKGGRFMMERVKLMIVDDSAIIRQAIHKHLKEFNIDVVGTAEDGKMALVFGWSSKRESLLLFQIFALT